MTLGLGLGLRKAVPWMRYLSRTESSTATGFGTCRVRGSYSYVGAPMFCNDDLILPTIRAREIKSRVPLDSSHLVGGGRTDTSSVVRLRTAAFILGASRQSFSKLEPEESSGLDPPLLRPADSATAIFRSWPL